MIIHVGWKWKKVELNQLEKLVGCWPLLQHRNAQMKSTLMKIINVTTRIEQKRKKERERKNPHRPLCCFFQSYN